MNDFRRLRAALGLSLATISLAPAWANDAEANAVYERFQAAYAELDPRAADTVYAADATYLPRHKIAGINRREQIRNGISTFQDQLRAKAGRVDIRFRVVERKRFENLIVDNGYIKITILRSPSTPEQVIYGKFLTVLSRQPDGHWAIVSDADADALESHYLAARPQDGLKFDF